MSVRRSKAARRREAAALARFRAGRGFGGRRRRPQRHPRPKPVRMCSNRGHSEAFTTWLMGYGPGCREPATYRAHYVDPDFSFRYTLYLCDRCMWFERTQHTQIPGRGPLRFYRFRTITSGPSYAECLKRIGYTG